MAKKRKRDDETVTILLLPLEMINYAFSFLPILDLIRSRRVSKAWKHSVDWCRERFRSLSIMYDGPACFDPMNCPFETDSHLLRDAIACLNNPPYRGSVWNVLIGDPLFQKEGFRSFFSEAFEMDYYAVGISLRATLSRAQDEFDLHWFVSTMGCRIINLTVDMRPALPTVDVVYAIGTIYCLAFENHELPARIYINRCEDMVQETVSVMHRQIEDIAGWLHLEGFGWDGRWNDWEKDVMHRIPMTALQMAIYGPEDAKFADMIASSRHAHTLDTLKFSISEMDDDIESSLCALIDACPKLRYASVRFEDCIGAYQVSKKLLVSLGANVTSLKIQTFIPYFTDQWILESEIPPLRSVRLLELSNSALSPVSSIMLLNLMPNLEAAHLDLDWITDNSTLTELCMRTRIPNIIIRYRCDDIFNIPGYRIRRYNSKFLLLSRMS